MKIEIRNQRSEVRCQRLIRLLLLWSLVIGHWSLVIPVSASTNRVVTGNLLLISGSPAITNLLFTPLSTPLKNNDTNLVVSTPTNVICDSLGAFSVKLNPGDYYVSIGSSQRDKFYISVPNAPGTYALTSLITNGITYTSRSNPIFEQLIHKDHALGYPSLDALGQVPASQLSNAVVIGGGITAAMATNITQGVFQGHLDPDDSSPLTGWQIVTPYTTQPSTNPATLVNHSFRIISLGTNRIAAEGDGGGDNQVWLQGNDGKSAVIDSLGNVFFSINAQYTNKFFLLRNDITAHGAICLGGASNRFIFLTASNLTALKIDFAGGLWDLYGSQILDPTNHTASDGLYNWRGPLTTKGISFTNIGTSTLVLINDDPVIYEAQPDGPGGLSYSIGTFGSPEAAGTRSGYQDISYTLNFTTSTVNPGSGGQGDGWYHFFSGSAIEDPSVARAAGEQVMLHSDGIYYSPSNVANRYPLASVSGGDLRMGASNTTWSLSSRFSKLYMDAVGIWYITNRSGIHYRLFDTDATLMSPDADVTWGGPCLDASARLQASGGTGTDEYFIRAILTNSTLISPKLTNAVNYGNPFSSPGAGDNSEQFGAGSTAVGTLSLAIGPGLPTAQATKPYTVAISGIAGGGLATAIGWGADALATNGTAIGANARVLTLFTNSTAIGAGATASDVNQVRLGATNHYVSIPGNLSAESNINLHTNSAINWPGVSIAEVDPGGIGLTLGTGELTATSLSASGLLFGGQIQTGAATNQIIFGGTNTPPQNTTTPVAWLSVKVNGLTNAFRFAIYQ